MSGQPGQPIGSCRQRSTARSVHSKVGLSLLNCVRPQAWVEGPVVPLFPTGTGPLMAKSSAPKSNGFSR
jgi:hypothetical protein